jgi:hypothetical protein
MSERDEIEQRVNEFWKFYTESNPGRYNDAVKLQAMITKSVLLLDKTVEKLDETSTKLATANNALAEANVRLAERGLWFTVVIVILTVVQIGIAVLKK